MGHNLKNDTPENPARRKALRRLAGATISAYVVPEMILLGAANAASSSAASVASPVSPASGPASGPSVDASGPSDTEPEMPAESGSKGAEYDDQNDGCNQDGSPRSQSIRIARSDLNRSQDAIEAGYARPLEQIWSEFTRQYDGRVIGVEFIGRRTSPRYKFKTISPSGRLETVVISAQTGDVIRVSGC